MMNKARAFKAVLLGAAMSVMVAGTAFATTPLDTVQTSVSTTFTDLTAFAVAAIPWLLGFAVIGIAIRFGLRLLNRAK